MGFLLTSLAIMGIAALAGCLKMQNDVIVAKSKEEAKKIRRETGGQVVRLSAGGQEAFVVTDETPETLKKAIAGLKDPKMASKYNDVVNDIKVLGAFMAAKGHTTISPSEAKKAVAQAKLALQESKIDASKIDVALVKDKDIDELHAQATEALRKGTDVALESVKTDFDRKAIGFIGGALGALCDIAADAAKKAVSGWNDFCVGVTKEEVKRQLEVLREKNERKNAAIRNGDIMPEEKVFVLDNDGNKVFVGTTSNISVRDLKRIFSKFDMGQNHGDIAREVKSLDNLHCQMKPLEVEAAVKAADEAAANGALDLSAVNVKEVR